jgi:prophage antirepressor-like protein
MIAQKNRTGYTAPALEKKSAGIGVPTTTGAHRLNPVLCGFFVCNVSPMAGLYGVSSDTPFPVARYANLYSSATPDWRRGRQVPKTCYRRDIMSQSIATSVASFSFENFPVRAINRNGEIWFVAADVCAAIDLGTEQIRRLDDDEKGLHLTQTPGGKQEMSIINESGLYALILRSRKPEAKRFRKWVTSEVLPAIRKTGAYIHAPAMRPALTTAQKRALKQKIWQMAPNWITQSGEQWIYNHLRVAFQVARFDDIPSDCFDAAMALLESKQKAISQYGELFYEMRTWFEREVLGASTPWTPHIRKMFFAKLGRQVILPPKVDWLALADEMKARKGGLK